MSMIENPVEVMDNIVITGEEEKTNDGVQDNNMKKITEERAKRIIK